MVSDIVQASKLSVIDNGGDLKDPTCGANRSRVSDLLAAHMSYSKKILPYSSDTDNCIRTTTKTLNGIVNAVASNQPGLVLNNGGCFAIMDYANHIARCPEIACPGSNYCTNVYMDVNGPNKGPNVIGKDIFWGSISYDGDYKPATYHGGLPGFEGSPANYVTSCATGTGVGCSTKYLLE